MTIRSVFQKFCFLLILLILASSIPTSSVSADWSGEFTLTSATYSANEFGGSVRITIRLTGRRVGSKPWNAAISYTTSDGTAFAGSDYTAVTGTKTLKKATTWSLYVPITSDSLIEGNETFNVTLSNPTNGATLGALTAAVVTIVDDDAAGI